MSDAPKRIEQEPLYPCCQCYDEYSWPKEDLRWYKNDLWCANCFDELDEDGERMLWSDLEPFVPKCDRELADCKADRVAISQKLSDALDALFASNKQLAEARAEIERKDKLIEQMRDALSDADDLIDEYAADYEHRDNVDEIRDEIKAALSAAERINK